MKSKKASKASKSFSKSFDNEGNINEDQDSVQPFHHVPMQNINDKSLISNIDLTQGAHDLSKNSLNLSKLINSDDDLDIDIEDPVT